MRPQNNNKKNILVLGANGMVGRSVYLYLNSLFPENTCGTTRRSTKKSNNIVFFRAENYQKDFANVLKLVKKIDYVINCIGILRNDSDRKDLIFINALFPHLLEELAETNNSKLIHISTDAVFSPTSGKVSEASPPSPTDYYGYSKLLGETSSRNALTFRSSFIGFDPFYHRGLLENVLQANGSVSGYTNQLWSGCTTIQFAKLCGTIISNDTFPSLRNASNVYHFAPLEPVSKYEVIEAFIEVMHIHKALKRTTNEKRRRILQTNYLDSLEINKYNNNIHQALKELVAFENTIRPLR